MEKKRAYERDGEKEGLRTTRQGNRTCLIYPSCSLCKWRARQGGNEFLQALGLQAGREVGPFLQPDHELVAMHLVICSTSFRNSVRSGCSLHSWPCSQGLLFACGSGISRGQHSTLLVTVFLVPILLPFSFPATLYSNHIFHYVNERCAKAARPFTRVRACSRAISRVSMVNTFEV